tara:strand:+ start:2303 stop:3811 length:1509 start_codon:yes stop_codon:yes gene_type:complete
MRVWLLLILGGFLSMPAQAQSPQAQSPQAQSPQAQSAQAQSAFEASVEQIQAAALGEANARFTSLVGLPEAEFRSRWNDIFDRNQARLDAVAAEYSISGLELKRAAVPLIYGRAWGGAVFASYHRQSPAGDPNYQPSDSYFSYLHGVDLAEAELLDQPDYLDFLSAHARSAGNLLTESDPRFRSGDHVGLRAALSVTAAYGNEATRCATDAALVTTALDSFGLDGLETIASETQARCPAYTAGIETALAAEDQYRAPARRDVYKTVNGADLALYIYEPVEAAPAGPGPTLVWFHGGGMSSGAWYWCVLCEAYRDAGWTVISVEYRLFLRHGTGPSEGGEDALDALRHIQDHAAALAVDPDRIVTAGFSIGANLAVGAGLLPQASDLRPAASVSLSGCLSWQGDAFARTRVGSSDELVPLAATHWLNAAAPPALFIHALDDPTCPVDRVAEHVASATGLGAEAELLPIESGGHFAMLRDAAARNLAISGSLEFLARQGVQASH